MSNKKIVTTYLFYPQAQKGLINRIYSQGEMRQNLSMDDLPF